MKDARQSLLDMLETIRRIESYSSRGEAVFRESLENQDAIIKNFLVLGEAVKRMPAEFQERERGIPWSEYARFRDVLIHQYDSVDLNAVWNAVHHEIPALKRQLQALLEQLPAP